MELFGCHFFWNFGDDSTSADTSNLKSPTYTYKRDGYYTVKLVAASPYCADTSEFDIYVKRNFKINIGKEVVEYAKKKLYTGTGTYILNQVFNFNIDPYLRTNVALVPVLPEMKVNLFNP